MANSPQLEISLNSFKISVKEFVAKTNAICIQAKAGRYGGTYAHKDIAFEFAMWISPEFKIYIVKEFQRLKSEEQKQLGWSAKRELTKINYRIHTDAIKNNLIPAEVTSEQTSFIYAYEADMLNVALFGMTAKQWRTKNPNKKGNMRDYHGDYGEPINDNAAECKNRIRSHIEKEYGYDLSKTLDEIRPKYKYDKYSHPKMKGCSAGRSGHKKAK